MRTLPAARLPRAALPLRTLSTTATAHQAPETRPESPNFIAVPQPPKIPTGWKPPVKGILPTPRPIFKESGPEKASWYYLARATPPRVNPVSGPRPEKADHPTKVEVAARAQWKRDMAEARRKNLREGILELRKREREYAARRRAISERNRLEREEKLHRIEAEDVRLTLPSVLSTIKESAITDPNREERLALMKARREAHEAKKLAETKENLHELYVNARSFILTEKQLDAAIEKAFPQNQMHWDAYMDFPPTARQMLASKIRKMTMEGESMGRYAASNMQATNEVGAALTGGKLVERR